MSLSNYVNSGVGIPVLRGPYMLKDANLSGFVLTANKTKLQTMCDKYLNHPMGSTAPYHFEAFIDKIFLIFASMKSYSLNQEDINTGWMKEIDFCFWIPMLVKKWDGSEYVIDWDKPFAFFLPQLFVDNGYAIAIGREVYGFNKSYSQFDGPADPRDPEFTVKTRAFKTLSPTTEGYMQPLMSVRRRQTSQDKVKPWTNAIEAGQEILKLLTGSKLGEVTINNRQFKLFDNLNINVPAVFLKQFRSVSNPDKAAYQAITRACFTLEKLHGGFPIFHKYDLFIEQLQSHPIVEEYGLEATDEGGRYKVETDAAFWLNIDFPMQLGKVLWEATGANKPTKQKVAVLGGGIGSLSTVYGLTSQPGWQDKYDITVYQLGWRLGGKGASGRNPHIAERIEEHGLHVWFGFYENSFKLIRQCYAELGRPSDAPLATWDQAFKPHDYYYLEEYFNEQWYPVRIPFPKRPGTPGDESLLKPWPRLLAELMRWAGDSFTSSLAAEISASQISPVEGVMNDIHQTLFNRPVADWTDTVAAQSSNHKHLLQRLTDEIFNEATKFGGLDAIIHGLFSKVIDTLEKAVQESLHDASAELWSVLQFLLKSLQKAIQLILDRGKNLLATLRLFLLTIEVSITTIIILIDKDVFLNGFDAIEDYDYRDLLKTYGASDAATYSAPVRMMYELPFAYPHGITGNHIPSREGSIGAGTLVLSAIMILAGYKGSSVWKMQAGMGDVVFTPIYQVLKARGVKFEFFNKVEELIPGHKTGTIDQIKLTRQVKLRDGLTEYNPLHEVKALPTWPSEPLYDQLDPAQAERLQANQINLESYWTAWNEGQLYTLQRGQDFDIIVLGISIGAFPYICPKLAEADYNPKGHDAWRTMVERVETMATQAVQLWLKPDLAGLGWDKPSPLLGAYAQSLTTWADMPQLLDKEAWPKGYDPGAIAYFCGSFEDENPDQPIPPFDQHDFPAQQKERVRQATIAWLKQNIQAIWPNMATADGFDWDKLIDLDGRTGVARFNGQYWRANVDPTERYVLSVPGSYQYRLKADESGIANLYLAGDWTNNTFLNVGCIESTVISGLLASRAISGSPQHIVYVDNR